MNIDRLTRAFFKGAAGMLTLTTILSCVVFVGVIDPPDVWAKVGACVLIAWATLSGVVTILLIDKGTGKP